MHSNFKGSMAAKRILFIAHHRKGRSPSQRFRFEQFESYFEQEGFECHSSHIISEQDDRALYAPGHYIQKSLILITCFFKRCRDLFKLKHYDLLFIQREAFIGTAFFERLFKRAGKPIVFDFDDAIWLLDISEGNKRFAFLKRPHKTAGIIALADTVIAGNEYLAAYARKFNTKVLVIPTTLNTNDFKPLEPTVRKDAVCIGWTGSHTTIKHFELAIPVLKRLKDKYGDGVYFKVIGATPNDTETGPLNLHAWRAETEIADIQELDIGIMPLPDDEWSKGKCAFKGLQYMALGIPAVMSAVGVNKELISDGKNGYLAMDEEAWFSKLCVLIENAELRKRIGAEGRKTIIANYSLDAWKQEYLRLFKQLA